MPFSEIQSALSERLARTYPEAAVCHPIAAKGVRTAPIRQMSERDRGQFCEILKRAFPVVCRILGPDVFQSLSLGFLRSYPSYSPPSEHFGVELPDYIDGLGLSWRAACLSDVARLEAMILGLSEVDDTPASDQLSTPDFSEPQYLDHVAEVSAPAELFMSSTGAVSIWQRFSSAQPLQLLPSAPRDDAALVMRQGGGAVVVPLHLPGCDVFVALLMRGHTLREARDGTWFVEPSFDVRGAMEFLARAGAVRAVSAGPSRCLPLTLKVPCRVPRPGVSRLLQRDGQ